MAGLDLFAGCQVDRDLDPARFTCAAGGLCDAGDGGVSDVSVHTDTGADAGAGRDWGIDLPDFGDCFPFCPEEDAS